MHSILSMPLSTSHNSNSSSRPERLDKYVKRFTANWLVRSRITTSNLGHGPSSMTRNTSNVSKTFDGEVFLLTGSTGTLGSQILANLIARPNVGRIYTFNRKHPKHSFRERHEAIFVDKGNDIKLLDSPKVVFVEGDLSVAGFGVSRELYNQMKNSVTTVIHNAWPVKFTKPLAEFEVNLQGVRNLIDFSLESPHERPPRLLFISSIGMVKAWAEIPPIAEAPLVDVDLVGQSGYAESKWVAERILTIAKQETVLEPLIIRVGQLSGGPNGSWTENEWFPALVGASRVIGCVPDCGDWSVGFVPLHKGANAIIELRSAPVDFAHIVHPRPISSIQLMQFVSESLGVRTVPIDRWLSKLRVWQQKTTGRQHPAFKLIDFYDTYLYPKMRLSRRYQITGMAMFETERTSKNIPFDFDVERLPPLGKAEVDRWIGHWRRHCWGEKEARYKESITLARL